MFVVHLNILSEKKKYITSIIYLPLEQSISYETNIEIHFRNCQYSYFMLHWGLFTDTKQHTEGGSTNGHTWVNHWRGRSLNWAFRRMDLDLNDKEPFLLKKKIM